MRRSGVYEQQKRYQETEALREEILVAARPIAKKLLNKQVTAVSYPDNTVKEYWEKQIRIVEVIEDKFEHKVLQFISGIERTFLSHLETEIADKDFIPFIQKDYFADQEDELLVKARLDLAPLLDAVAVLAGQEANKLIGIFRMIIKE